MTMTLGCNLGDAFLLGGVCAFLCGLPGHLVHLVFVGGCDGFRPIFP